jgi:hypothetical protein
MKKIAWLVFFAVAIWQLAKFADTFDQAWFAARYAAMDAKQSPAYKLLMEDK